MRHALAHFFEHSHAGSNSRRYSRCNSRSYSRSYSRYTALVITRHDVTLLSPVTSWLCALHATINVAAKCEPAAWSRYRCVSDLMFTVPRGRLHAFNASIGSHLGASTRRADG